MSKLFEQFKKETGDNWSYKNGWDFAPEEIVTQKYIEWLEQKITSDNSDYDTTQKEEETTSSRLNKP